MADHQHLERLSRELVDKGKLIEAGWIGLSLAALPLDTPAVRLEDMRSAFFAGANHLFSSIMTVLEPGAEPSDKDLQRMDLIAAELQAFIQAYELRHFPAKGSA